MPGALCWDFRQGDRSEYLALYILSALGIAVKVPREEDIGADFYCSLAKQEGKKLTFHSPFIVQVKSESVKANVFYGGPNDKGTWRQQEIEWLFSQKLPLLLAVVDKSSSTLKLYSTSNMWTLRYKGGNLGMVHLQPDVPSGPDDEIPRPPAEQKTEWPKDIGDGQLWRIPLGPPLVAINIGDVEDPAKLEAFRKILSWAVGMEQTNILYRDLNVHFSRWRHKIKTNSQGEAVVYGVGYVFNTQPGANTADQLRALAPILGALALNFKHQGRKAEFEALKPLVEILPSESLEVQELRRLVEGL